MEVDPPSAAARVTPWWTEPFDDQWTLSSLLESASERYGENPAVFDAREGFVTHAEIARRSARLRGALLAACPEGARVVGCLSTLGPHWYAAVHAVCTSGLIYAALDPEAPDERNLLCLESCGADVILADRASIGIAHRLAADRVPVVEIEAGTEEGKAVVAVEVDPQAPAGYLFTSGSTGRPKAVIRSHRSYAHAAYSFGLTYTYGPEDVKLYAGSPAHVGTLNDAVCGLLCGYASIPVGISNFSVSRMVDLLQAQRATVLSLPPSLLRPVLQRLDTQSADVALRLVITSGAALRRVDIGLFHEVMQGRAEIWQNYGSTEAGPISAAGYEAGDAEREGGLPLRVPAHGCEVELRGEDGAAVASGEVGEVIIRSEYLADGYLSASAEDRARFDADERGRTYRIGDRGYRTEDGELVLVGRGDRQISVHGRRFDLGEIESVILSDPSWSAAVALQVELQSGRVALAAVLEPASSEPPGMGATRQRLAELIPAAFVPQRILVLENLPRTTTGKLDLAAVEELAVSRIVTEPTGAGGPPKGAAESWIADCWEHVLGITWPGREESFADLGGDSLAAIELLLMLEQRFGVSLSLDLFAQAQTIAEQVGLVGGADRGDVDPLIRLRSDGEGPLVVLLPGIGGHAWVFAELARRLDRPCDVLGVSLLDLSLPNADSCGPESIAGYIAEHVRGLAADRPILLGGYSFGAVICCEVAAALEHENVKLSRILLMDPLPLDGADIGKRLRGWARSMRRAVVGTGAAPRSAAAARLEREVAAMNRVLTAAYPLPPTPLDDQPTSLLLTTVGRAELAQRESVFGRPLASIDIVEFACDHLDVLRGSHVAQTAGWLDAQLDRVT